MRRTCTSPRLKGFDYSSNNFYFVTSVVKNRIPCFGNVIDGKMILNEFGKIAEQQWYWLAEQFAYVRLHAFVVMPDHIHGIIEIDHRYSAGEKIKSLSELMGAYKMTSSKKIHLAGYDAFKWQRSFHDRIIRNHRERYWISKYIDENPEKYPR